MYAVYKTAASTVQLANFILLHAYARPAASPQLHARVYTKTSYNLLI